MASLVRSADWSEMIHSTSSAVASSHPILEPQAVASSSHLWVYTCYPCPG